ncbi:hypothetical protein F5Y04DRAFT_61783 [Hypomontagnella monticulosa]|nr:hypothetical protein F5Y04DRAFT_61783 [Hypomontagnella monticulosa]
MTITSAFWRQQIRLLSTLTSPATASRPQAPTSPLLHQLLRRSRSRTPQCPRNRRFQSSKPPSSPASQTQSSTASTARQAQRADAILQRATRWVPKRLHPYLARLRSAPVSHVFAFLVLHEATAILPLFGLAYLFHAMDWVPTAWVLGPWAASAEEGLRRYARYFRRKGWFGMSEEGGMEGEERLEERLREEVRLEKEREGHGEGRKGWLRFWKRDKSDDEAALNEVETEAGKSKSATAWGKVKKAVTVDNTEKGYKIGVQIAAAYAITKMLFIPRIALSLWATPWLARGFVAFRRAIWQKRN